jgi:hypothetical protein
MATGQILEVKPAILALVRGKLAVPGIEFLLGERISLLRRSVFWE